MDIASRHEAIFNIIETEFPSVDLADVENLAAKVEKGIEFETALRALIAIPGYYRHAAALKLAYDRYREIQGLTEGALKGLAEEVERRSAEQLAKKLTEQRLLEEREFLDSPSTQAHFDDFVPLHYWKVHEAVCLLLGKDPRSLKSSYIRGAPSGSTFAKKYRELSERVVRASKAGLIGSKNRIDPPRLFEWAESNGIEVPAPLSATLENAKAVKKETQEPLPAIPSASPNEPVSPKLARAKRNEERAQKIAVSRHHRTLLLLLYALLHANTRTPKVAPAKLADIETFLRGVLKRECPHEQTLNKVMAEIDAQVAELQSELNDIQTDMEET